MPSEKDLLDQLLAEAGLDVNTDLTMEGDLSQHIWESNQKGGAIWSTDGYKFKCSRCGREMELQPVMAIEPENLSDEAVEQWNEEHKHNQPTWETFNQAMTRLKINSNCGDEVMTDVMTR